MFLKGKYFEAWGMFLFDEHRALHGAKRVINIRFGTIKTLRGISDANDNNISL